MSVNMKSHENIFRGLTIQNMNNGKGLCTGLNKIFLSGSKYLLSLWLWWLLMDLRTNMKKKIICNVFIIHPCKLNVGESKDIDFSCYWYLK